MPLLRNFNNFRNGLAKIISTADNQYFDAFLQFMGAGHTRYDEDASTYVEMGYAGNPDVYAVVKQQADKHSSIPRSIKTIKDRQAKKKLDSLRLVTKGNMTPQQRFEMKVLESRAFDEKELDWPLEKPNVLQTWSELERLEKVFLKTTGNVFYYQVMPDGGLNKGEPQQVYILPSHLIQIVLKDKANLLSNESPIDYYMLREGNMYTKFDAEEVFHVKYANPLFDFEGSHLYGLSPLKAALKNIESSNSARDNNVKTLASGGAFGFLHSKGQHVLTPDQAQELKSRLKEMDSDPGRLAKLTGVSAEIGFTRISLTTDELKPFDYLKYDQKTICNVLGWSDKLLNNDDGGKYDNVSQFRRQVITDNIMPDNTLINQAFQEHFIRKFKGYQNAVLESSYDELPELQVDMTEMMGWIKDAIDIGLISRNEGRKVIKFIESEDKDMDVITVTQDVIPLSEAIDETFRLNPKQAV